MERNGYWIVYLANAQLHDELADLLGAGVGSTLTRNGIFMSSISLRCLWTERVCAEWEREREKHNKL